MHRMQKTFEIFCIRNFYATYTFYIWKERGVNTLFIVSFKATKKKIILLAAILLAVIVVIAVACFSGKGEAMETAAGYSLLAQTEEQRAQFLAQYGWETADEPSEICEVIIPEEFNQVYQNYNAIQKQQEMDLGKYKGKRVKKWTYQVLNYPDRPEGVFANLLVYEGRVIGGDISSSELGGFMHGFDRSAIYNSQPDSGNTGSSVSSSEQTASSVPELAVSSVVPAA